MIGIEKMIAVYSAADRLSKSATAAYWLSETAGVHPDRPKFHLSQVDNEFRQLAALLGYRVEGTSNERVAA